MKIIDIKNSEKPVTSLTLDDAFLDSKAIHFYFKPPGNIGIKILTNWRVLVTSNTKKDRVTISPERGIEFANDPGLRKARYCMSTYGDAITLVHDVKETWLWKGYNLIIEDFLPTVLCK